MIRYHRHLRWLAACLSALAGYVDALGFMETKGFFVSFMSGNSTRLGVGGAQLSGEALIAGGLILAFLIGVIAGSLTGHFGRKLQGPMVLGLVALALAAGACLHDIGASGVAVFAMVLGMGAENAVFQREGEVSIGLTYMTGTLVKLGQRIVGALLGNGRFDWIPYLLLWLGLVLGAGAGAFVHPRIGLDGLWLAAAAAAVLAVYAARNDIAKAELVTSPAETG